VTAGLTSTSCGVLPQTAVRSIIPGPVNEEYDGLVDDHKREDGTSDNGKQAHGHGGRCPWSPAPNRGNCGTHVREFLNGLEAHRLRPVALGQDRAGRSRPTRRSRGVHRECGARDVTGTTIDKLNRAGSFVVDESIPDDRRIQLAPNTRGDRGRRGAGVAAWPCTTGIGSGLVTAFRPTRRPDARRLGALTQTVSRREAQRYGLRCWAMRCAVEDGTPASVAASVSTRIASHEALGEPELAATIHPALGAGAP
jgi:hypothetical protein